MSADDVTDARLRWLNGETMTAIAADLDMSKNTVTKMLRGETYTDVPYPARCGTVAGYLAHLWRGDELCAACVEAHRANSRRAAWREHAPYRRLRQREEWAQRKKKKKTNA